MYDVNVSANITEDIAGLTRDGLFRFLRDGAQRGQAVAMEEVPQDRGGLMHDMAQFVPEDRGDRVVWGVSDKPYALAIEEGTEPYWPPIQPLIEWANRVGGDDSLGYYVQWKIAQEGIDEQPYLQPGAEAQADWYSSHDPASYVEDNLE